MDDGAQYSARARGRGLAPAGRSHAILASMVYSMSQSAPTIAESIIYTLRRHEVSSQRAGIRRLSPFGSIARGEAHAASDVDLAAEFDPAAKMDLIRWSDWSASWARCWAGRCRFFRSPIEAPRLRVSVERDRVRAALARAARTHHVRRSRAAVNRT